MPGTKDEFKLHGARVEPKHLAKLARKWNKPFLVAFTTNTKNKIVQVSIQFLAEHALFKAKAGVQKKQGQACEAGGPTQSAT